MWVEGAPRLRPHLRESVNPVVETGKGEICNDEKSSTNDCGTAGNALACALRSWMAVRKLGVTAQERERDG